MSEPNKSAVLLFDTFAKCTPSDEESNAATRLAIFNSWKKAQSSIITRPEDMGASHIMAALALNWNLIDNMPVPAGTKDQCVGLRSALHLAFNNLAPNSVIPERVVGVLNSSITF